MPPISLTVGVSCSFRDLDAVSADGPREPGCRVLAHLSQQGLQRSGSSDNPKNLSFGQYHDGAIGIEEAGGILGDLLHDAVQLDRLRQDIAELLQREELADTPVDLCRELVGLPLGVLAPPARAQRRHGECPHGAGHRHDGQPPDAVLGPTRHDAEKHRRCGVQGELPPFLPGGKQHDQRPRRSDGERR